MAGCMGPGEMVCPPSPSPLASILPSVQTGISLFSFLLPTFLPSLHLLFTGSDALAEKPKGGYFARSTKERCLVGTSSGAKESAPKRPTRVQNSRGTAHSVFQALFQFYTPSPFHLEQCTTCHHCPTFDRLHETAGYLCRGFGLWQRPGGGVIWRAAVRRRPARNGLPWCESSPQFCSWSGTVFRAEHPEHSKGMLLQPQAQARSDGRCLSPSVCFPEFFLLTHSPPLKNS
jgi:hypothetical protein